jgi:choline dehydrogenase
MDAGDYLIRAGDSSRSTSVQAKVRLNDTIVTQKVNNELTDQAPPTELTSTPSDFYSYAGEAKEIKTALVDPLQTKGFTPANHASAYEQNVPVDSASPYYAIDNSPISSTTAYLDPARERENLVVRGDSLVHHVVIDSGRAVGVVLEDGSTADADRVIVATGAYASPGLLRRSGLDLPGIGQNLIDHPAVSVDLPYHGPTPDLPQYQLVATLHSSQADPATDPPDLQVLAVGPFPAEDGSGAGFALAAALLKPRSRGSVGEHIDLNYFDEADDMRRMLEGLDHVLALVDHPAIRDLTLGATPSVPDNSERPAWIREQAWSYHHPVGTCAMGSVVDERCEVYGVAGMSVIDASVMPDIPSANTHLPVTAIAEHLAATAL